MTAAKFIGVVLGDALTLATAVVAWQVAGLAGPVLYLAFRTAVKGASVAHLSRRRA